jgi:DNA-binding IclR family transcriptional regulator
LCLYKVTARTAVMAESIRSPHPLQFVFEPFAEISLAWGSLGRSILAELPGEDIDAVLASRRPGPLSRKPLPSRRNLLRDLRDIKRRGHAVYMDATLNIAGVAAPIFGPGGFVLGCLGVTMPASRFDASVRSGLAKAVPKASRKVSAALGVTGKLGR